MTCAQQLATVSVDPDRKHILSATEDSVLLLGDLYADDDSDSRCILIVPRVAYLAAMSEWLDGKTEYWNRYSYFAGVGCILWEDAKLCKNRSFHLTDYVETGDEDDENDGIVAKQVDVPGYAAAKFTVDMEHG